MGKAQNSAKTLAIANRKGGCGKTMTAVSLAAGLARNGKRVLCIDTDSQGSLSVSLGVATPDKLTATLATRHQRTRIRPANGRSTPLGGRGFYARQQ